MTDAGYHPQFLGDKNSVRQYIAHEKEQVEKLGYEFDLFKIWDRIPKEKLFFFPTTFSGCLSPEHKKDYGRMAEQGNGVYMYVEKRDSAIISNAMVAILGNILDRLNGETEEELKQIEGFKFFDTSKLNIVTDETQDRHGEMIDLSSNDLESEQYFQTKMNKIITIIGSGWSKRKITLDPLCLLWQMKLIGYSIKYLTGDDTVKPQVEEALEMVLKTIPEEQARFLNISMDIIEELRNQVHTI